MTTPELRKRPPVRKVRCTLLIAILIACGIPTTAPAAEEIAAFRGRVGWLTGDTVGRSESLAHIELMPYFRTNNGLAFLDTRFFISDGDVGANLGLGYRTLVSDLDRVFGGIVWFDLDELSGEQTQQITVSLESYGEAVDALANLYVPVGDDSIGGLTTQNARFSGTRLLYDQVGTVGEVLGGGDVQLGYLLPGRFADDHSLRVFAGAYHYSGSSVDDVSGFLARVEATFLNAVDTQVKLTTDDTFGTNVLFGISLGVSGSLRAGQWRPCDPDSLTRYPTRQYNTVVVSNDVNRTGQVASNPATGSAWSFSHVSSAAGGLLNGSVEDPYDSLSTAIASGADYVLVHGGSVFTGAAADVALAGGSRVWGEAPGLQHELAVDGVGSLVLPTVAGGATPVLRGSTGNTVTMANDSQFRGFTIEDSGNNGIVLDGINGAMVRDVSVVNSAANGILATNISGSVSILDASVTDAVGAALRIDSVTGQVIAGGSYVNTTGQALVLDNIGAGADIDLTQATFSNDSGSGLMFNQVGGNVVLSDVSLLDSTASGINIDGGTGSITFTGTTTIENALGDAVSLHNSDANVTFESLVIRDPGGHGISVFNNANTASLTVSGTTTISGAADDSISIRDNDARVTFNDMTIENRHAGGIRITGTAGQVQFDNNTHIANQHNVSDSAVSISDSSADVVFVGELDIDDATGDPAVDLFDNDGTTGFANLNIDAAGGDGLSAYNAGTVTVLDGSINTTNGAAMDIADTATDISLLSMSVDGGDFGFRLRNTTGEVVVNGDAENTPGSGGFIDNTTTAIVLEDAGIVGIRHMTFDNNFEGVVADGAERFAFWDSQITNSTGWAIDAMNVRTIDILTSDFTDNGESLRFLSDADGAHTVLLSDIGVSSGQAAAMQILGTNDADLNVIIDNSIFLSDADNVNLIDIAGEALLTVDLSDTRLQSSGDDVTLLNLTGNSATDLMKVTIYNNLFSPAGSSSTGIATTTTGPSELQYEQNTIVFAASRGIGMDFDLAGSATVGVYSNLITDNFDGATATLFRSVTGPSSIEFAGNEFQFANLGGLSDRGFIFENVSGDVNLFGALNNIVSGASTPWFVPSGRTRGSFLVNGVRVP